MSVAIRELLEAGELSTETIDAFLADRKVPIVEGTTVTFLYRGRADAVHLQHWIFGLPAAVPFQRVDGTDLWYLVQEIPARSRVEYKLEVQEGDLSRLIRDPLNPLLAHDPFGANSVCQGAGYEAPEWAETRPGGARRARSRRSEIDSAALGRRDEVRVYTPARFRSTRRYPLLVVHDGLDYLRFSSLQTVLDNLIHRNEVAPMIVALTQSRDRLREYAADESHSQLPRRRAAAATRGGPIRSRRAPRTAGLMGASFGAVAAFATARRHPERFGRLLLQSGSFAFTDIGPSRRGPAFEPVVEFVNAFREDPDPPGRARLRQLRRLRIADLREPLAGADPAEARHAGALRRVARRPQLGELAGSPARGAVVPLSRPALDDLRVALS